MSVIEEERVRGGVFKDINADDEDQQPTVIESLCMNCYKDGSTRLLMTKIPFFKEIIISSFTCPHCNWTNTEIQSAGRIQEQGVLYTLQVKTKQDMNREVVKSDSASTRIPQLDFEIPPYTQKGSLSTIEGLVDRAVAGLEQDQPIRKGTDPAVAEKIDEFIQRLKNLKEVQEEFTLIIDDPSGNSFIENPFAPQKDTALSVTYYNRTAEQNAALGIAEEEKEDEKAGDDIDAMRNEVLVFNTNCPECNAPANTNMKLVQIPHFKEVIIMATNCDSCGHRTNEVKSGGATEDQGTRITLHLTDPSDMSRDLLKSETCSVLIPELEFELGMAAVGGKFTTLEGLLKDIKDLIVSKNPFMCGDSFTADRAGKLELFGQKIDKIMAGEMDVHVILDDPAGNSYIQNVYAPDPDPEMKIEKYTRTFEQNEDLGLNDMKTEGYAEKEA
ncbi:zinc finger protein ZPR1 [Pimephales promelas]|uniref:zinc finger protein ZPR1 n=1 Tax=Pimephales promelas TaxID=90988 RepID=UPI0019558DDB|nr:zinc finger protein ZPR1 [Pimephales promelas]KAG1970502.1 ZPR1 zinc-finger domain protein [Pimephales promelas]